MPGLEQRFLQLSWKLHPDNFVNASAEEQADSLKRSSALNDAYRVLRDLKNNALVKQDSTLGAPTTTSSSSSS